jgi:predicted kinase
MEEQIYTEITRGVHKPKKHKIAVFLCGSSGTGKTTTKQKILNDAGLKGTYVDLNIDTVTQMVGSREKAFQMFGYLIRQTMADGYSLLYDGTCRDKGTMSRRILMAKELGYKVVMGMTYTTLDTALKRILGRTEQPLDEKIAREIYGQVSKVAESLVKLKTVDEVYLYNNEHTSTLMFHKAKKSVQCIHSDMDFYFDVSDFC